MKTFNDNPDDIEQTVIKILKKFDIPYKIRDYKTEVKYELPKGFDVQIKKYFGTPYASRGVMMPTSAGDGEVILLRVFDFDKPYIKEFLAWAKSNGYREMNGYHCAQWGTWKFGKFKSINEFKVLLNKAMELSGFYDVNESMKLDEAKQILEDNGYILDLLSDLGVDVNNGIQDIEPTTAYEIDVNDPVCPCCGKKLKVINKDIETEEFIGESLNEGWEKQYINDCIQDVADQLYEEELNDYQPEVDEYGNISPDYLKRFEYTSPELRRAAKRAATKLSNDLKEVGITINPWYCEMEIYDKLKMFSK